MEKSIEEVAGRIEEAIAGGEPFEVMQLKLRLETSASKLFLALGWLLREGRIVLEPSDYGYRVQAVSATAPSEV